MARRNEYCVLLDKTKFAAPHEIKVFADEIMMTNTGDVVFSQIRQVKVVRPDGAVAYDNEMATVLVVVSGTFIRISQVNEHGAELYKESGAIAVLQ